MYVSCDSCVDRFKVYGYPCIHKRDKPAKAIILYLPPIHEASLSLSLSQVFLSHDVSFVFYRRLSSPPSHYCLSRRSFQCLSQQGPLHPRVTSVTFLFLPPCLSAYASCGPRPCLRMAKQAEGSAGKDNPRDTRERSRERRDRQRRIAQERGNGRGARETDLYGGVRSRERESLRTPPCKAFEHLRWAFRLRLALRERRRAVCHDESASRVDTVRRQAQLLECRQTLYRRRNRERKGEMQQASEGTEACAQGRARERGQCCYCGGCSKAGAQSFYSHTTRADAMKHKSILGSIFVRGKSRKHSVVQGRQGLSRVARDTSETSLWAPFETDTAACPQCAYVHVCVRASHTRTHTKHTHAHTRASAYTHTHEDREGWRGA